MCSFIFIIIGFFAILFLFIVVIYVTYPCINMLIKYLYIKWKKLSDKKRKTYTDILIFILLLILFAKTIINEIQP